VFSEALSLAEPAGFVRTFVGWGSRIVPFLRAAAVQGLSEDYVSRLLELTDQTIEVERIRPSVSVHDSGPLSDREMQVLRLLAAHLTSRDIAEELTIATSTVRSHMKNIYRKLDVHSRREAVERGQDIGLLP
jgi:LuxR family maltose regulon positive regulatory protein